MATKAELACKWMVDKANDNRYGYAWGGWGPYDYDCGHAIITAYEENGVPLKTKGATYTGNLYEVALICGFKDVTNEVSKYNGSGCKKGDILLNCASHAAMYCGNGQLVHARSSENNSVSGDANGAEWRVQSYYNHPWDYILRYEEDGTTDDDSNITIATTTVAKTTVANAKSDIGDGKGTAALQGCLKYLGYNLGPWTNWCDGDSGDAYSYTNKALNSAISDGKLTQAEADTLLSINP